jgi:esterase/lipase
MFETGPGNDRPAQAPPGVEVPRAPEISRPVYTAPLNELSAAASVTSLMPVPTVPEGELVQGPSAILHQTQPHSSQQATSTRGILQRAYQNPDGWVARFLEWLGPIRFHVPMQDRFGAFGDKFEKHARPYIIPGTSDAQPILYFSGLNATTYEWKEVARDFHHRTQTHQEVYTLPGHDGKWSSFLSVTDKVWIGFVIERALDLRARTGRLPVLAGHSTGAAAILAALEQYAADNNGALLGSGVVLSGLPVRLKQTLKHSIPLIHADKELRRTPNDALWNHFCAEMPRSDDPNLTYLDMKNPSSRFVPVKLLVQLWRLIPQARSGLQSLTIPALVLQGSRDHLVDEKGVEMALRSCPSPDKTFHLFESGRHSAMFGTTKREFHAVLFDWLRTHKAKLEAVERRELRRELLTQIAQRIQQREEVTSLDFGGTSLSELRMPRIK